MAEPAVAPGVVPESPPGWTPTAARFVADTWRAVQRTAVARGRGDPTKILTPPSGSADAAAGAGIVVRVVDDLGDGVPGAIVSVSRRDAKGRDVGGEFTTGAEGLVPRRFEGVGRFDVGLDAAPAGWLTRTADGFVPSVAVMVEADGGERVVEVRMTIQRASVLEIDVPGASSVRPRESSVRLAGLGVQRDDGSVVWGNWCSAECDGNRIAWKRLPAGAAYAFVNVDDVGAAGVWSRLEVGQATRARMDLETDGTSLAVRVPPSKTPVEHVYASVLQLRDSIGPAVWRTKSFLPATGGGDVVVDFRNLAAGRYLVRAGFQDGASLRPALVELRRGENRLTFPADFDDVATADVPVVWAQRLDGSWQCPVRPTLVVFPAESSPGPRFASADVVDGRENVVRAPSGRSEVLAIQQPGAWFADGANYRLLRLDVPDARTFEPDRP